MVAFHYFFEGENPGVAFYADIQHQALNKNNSHIPEEDLVIGQVKEINFFFCLQDAKALSTIVLFPVVMV